MFKRIEHGSIRAQCEGQRQWCFSYLMTGCEDSARGDRDNCVAIVRRYQQELTPIQL